MPHPDALNGPTVGPFATTNFGERFSVLKNSLGARFQSKPGTKCTDFGAPRARFVVAISSMPTFSTGWLLPRTRVNKGKK